MEAGEIQDPFLLPIPTSATSSTHTHSRPVSDLGSLAMEPNRLTTFTTKFFSRVKLVYPILSELSMTNMISRAPQRFSQSEEWGRKRKSQRRFCNGANKSRGVRRDQFTHHSIHTSLARRSSRHSPASKNVQCECLPPSLRERFSFSFLPGHPSLLSLAPLGSHRPLWLCSWQDVFSPAQCLLC